MKTAFVTGAGKGLGAEICKHLLSQGMNVYGASRNASVPNGIEVNENFMVGEIDVSDESSCFNALNDCIAKFGDIDIIVNNASGALGGKSLGEYMGKNIFEDISVTLGGAICVTNTAVKVLTEHALELSPLHRRVIIFISSSSGMLNEIGNEHWSIYAAGKAGIIRFAECAGDDLREKGIATNVIIPHNIRTSNFIEQEAISTADVMKTLDFFLHDNDNMNVKRMFIQPWQG